jgi:anaerobic magnesium-protoporphyrin IX monomethyl ester cyclase
MRVALINARMSWSSVVPTGLLSIATVLRDDGHAVRVFDAYYTDQQLVERVAAFKPELVGVSFMTTEYPRAKAILRLCKERLPDVAFCAGGYHVSALPERTLRELPLDFCVLSEGELTMQELCRRSTSDLKNPSSLRDVQGIAFLGPDGEFVATPARPFIDDLDKLPIIDRELLDGGMGWYLTLPGNIRGHLVERCTTILTSRGCPGNCLFCSSRAMWTNRMRQRSSQNILDEIELLQKKYDVQGLFFLDDTFTANPRWILEFCEQWKQRGIRMTWGCSARVNTVREDILGPMKEIGCVQLDFGVESGNDEVLKRLHKGQNKEVILRAFDLLHKFKLNSLACFIIGNPGETEKEIFETFEVAKRIRPDFAIFSILTPLPGSPLYGMAIENGWITGKEDFNVNWSIRHSEMPVMGIELSPTRLLELRKKMEDRFFFVNYWHYLRPLLIHPRFILSLMFQVLRKPKKYLSILCGKRSRRFSGFVEAMYYDYKEHMAQKITVKLPRAGDAESPYDASQE